MPLLAFEEYFPTINEFVKESDEKRTSRNVEVERRIAIARRQATQAVRELNEIVSSTNAERLFAFLFYHIAINGARGDRIERAKVPVKLEFAFFHLAPHFGNVNGPPLDAASIQQALDAVDSLYEAQALGASGFFDAQRPIDDLSFLRMSLYFEATLARGSAYRLQLRNQILGIQAKFDDWFEARAKIRPSRAVVLIDAAFKSLSTNCESLQNLAFDHGQLEKEAFRAANPGRTIEEAFAIVISAKLSDAALDVLPVAASQIKLEPPPSTEEWTGLINLVGCSPWRALR